MSFDDALKTLGIERYKKRIYKSNSHGELFHLYDYVMIANVVGDDPEFSGYFDELVGFAEENWERPESVFQHIPKMMGGV